MARRDALALVRAPAVRPAVPLPPRRALAWTALAVFLLALAYLAARQSSVFALESVRIAGAPPGVAADVREALARSEGESLVGLDPDAVERALRAVPTVKAVHVDRAFPHTLDVRVAPERPLTVVRDGERAWLVAESGRVVASVEPNARRRLPRIRLELERAPTVGGTLAAREAGDALAVLRALPDRFPAAVVHARVASDGVVLVVRPWVEIRLGPPLDLDAKLASAAAVLRSLSSDELGATGYLDVSLPQRVVTGANAQPESDG